MSGRPPSRRRPGRQLRVRRSRSQTERKFRLRKPLWQDPYPQIPGTDPEKRIFAALIQMRIYFIFHGRSPADAKLVAPLEDDHDIDFTLPEYKVIIDPFSPFAHSQPDSVTRDARKLAIFAAAGWETYHPWAVAPGVFVLDQPQHNISSSNLGGKLILVLGKDGKRHVRFHKAPATPHSRPMGALDLLQQLPLIQAGPRYPLTDPADIEANRLQGYRIGPHLGAGAGGVAAANHARRRAKSLGFGIRGL